MGTYSYISESNSSMKNHVDLERHPIPATPILVIHVSFSFLLPRFYNPTKFNRVTLNLFAKYESKS